MLELIFVIVIMGILAKFGAEIFRNVYDTFTRTTVNNRLQTETELTLKQLSNRLHYRIKNSVIGRVNATTWSGISSVNTNATVLEWIGYDIDGWLGNTHGGTLNYNRPTWTGLIDVDALDTANADNNTLFSPGSDTGQINTVINAVSGGGTGITNSAIFFTGANADVQEHFGWDSAAIVEQNGTAAHRITTGVNVQQFDAAVDNFIGVDIYEQYKLSWTAYAVSIEDFDGDGAAEELVLYYDYQPWEGEAYTTGTSVLLLENVDTFKFQGVGDLIKLQICVNDGNILNEAGGYSLCKEKAIF
jgi:type II secretory pathway pseudopilin PulG